MNRETLGKLRVLGLIWLLVLGAAACDVQSTPVDSASSDWSRALRVGASSLNNLPTILVDDVGRAYMVWVAAYSGGQTLHYVRMSPAGNVEVERDLVEVAFGYPDSPLLVKAAGDQLHLAWLARAATADHPQGFYHVLLGGTGEVQGTPICLSGTKRLVGGQGVLCPAPAGGAYAFWSGEAGSAADLYAATVNAAGAIETGPALLVPGGASPEAQTDAQGRVHLIWQQQPGVQADRTLYYGVYDPQTRNLSAPNAVTLVKTGSTNVLTGPFLGLTNDRAYVLWSLEGRGKGGGTAQTYYLTWVLGQPPQEMTNPQQLWMPDEFRPEYTTAASLGLSQTGFNTTSLAPVSEGFASFVMQPGILAGQHNVLLASLTTTASTLRVDSQPVALMVFADGEPKAYQLITRLDGLSERSSLRTDANGNLYVLWLHPAGTFNYDVFYASTSAAVRATLNPWTATDFYSRGLNYSFSLGVALGFFPLAMVWVFFSFFWLGFTYLIFGDAELDERRGWAILVVALLLHFFSKFFSLPGMFSFLPFMEGLPDVVAFVIGRILGPLLLSGVGLLVMAIYLKRAEHREAFGAYVVFALVDIVVTLVVYIPTMLGGGY